MPEIASNKPCLSYNKRLIYRNLGKETAERHLSMTSGDSSFAMPVPCKFLVGLSSFLNQANLSIDRLPREDLSALIDFYTNKSKYTPSQIVRKLDDFSRQPEAENSFSTGFEIAFLGKVSCPYPQLYFAQQALKHLEVLLADRKMWQARFVIDVRLELASASALVEEKIPMFKRNTNRPVFHLNQNDQLTTRSVENLAGDDWLECIFFGNHRRP